LASAASQLTAAKVSAARLSIISNTLLTTLKLIVGIWTGSVSVLSEAAHSANDLLAAGVAFFSVHLSDRPADSGHPYGHGKIESISGLVEALLIFAAAAYILYESYKKLVSGVSEFMVGPGIAVMLISTIVNIAVSYRLFKVADETDSLALRADAEHLRTDVITSIGVVLGLVVVYVTGWSVLDPIVAIGVALLICSAAYRLTRDAMYGLLDAVLPDSEVQTVRAVLDSEPAVLAYHKLRTRKSGSSRQVDAHILVDDNLTLSEAHELTESLEDRIRARLPRTEVTLHTEPHDAEVKHQQEHHGGSQ
jgi:cation diffusion facilitator family transporter